jgi:hypothetical protein
MSQKFFRRMAHRQLCLGPGNESQFVLAAVFVLGQLEGNDRRSAIPKARPLPARRVAVVIFRQEHRVHQARAQRHLAGMGHGASLPVLVGSFAGDVELPGL